MPLTFCFPDEDGVVHCHDIPALILSNPREVNPPDPGPERRFLNDLFTLATIKELGSRIANREILAGLNGGLQVALKAAQAAAPKGVRVQEKDLAAHEYAAS